MTRTKKKRKLDYWICEYCGSTDCWFDRSMTLDDNGEEIESMGYVCDKCGKKESAAMRRDEK